MVNKKRIDPEEEKYMIKIKDDANLKDKKAFHKVYSNGPLHREDDKKKYVRGSKDNVIRDRAARFIQRVFRGHRVRKRTMFNRKYFHTKWILYGGNVDLKEN